jgi:anti-sigma factor RsiW
MTCREFIEFMMEYLDHELSEQERAVFDQHLSICPPCEAYLDSYKKTVELGKASFADCGDGELPHDVPEDLIEAILAARSKK